MTNQTELTAAQSIVMAALADGEPHSPLAWHKSTVVALQRKGFIKKLKNGFVKATAAGRKSVK